MLGVPAVAHAADNGRWSVYPYATQLGSRPYFVLTADPGTTVRDRVVVANKAAEPVTFRLYAADAYNTPRDGGFAVRDRTEQQRGVGRWVRLPRTKVKVPAHGSVTVPFSLRVPPGAEPGDHPGALVALDERVADAGGDGAVAVGVRRAVGARVYLRVGGPTLPAVSVEDLRIEQNRPVVPGLGASTAVVSYTLRNRGNVTLDPVVSLRAEGLFGRTLLSRTLDRVPSELLPGQKVRLTERWSGAPQFDWGDVTVTASAQRTRESGRVGFVAVPWVVLAVVFVGGVGVGVVARVRVRARRRRGAVVG
ncbi:DUF916 domain-containing protein [Streptomyces sp. VRA16 Mangrove soil]|nr:DUF916 domain-containing protein [Streptomyces sp. VRA16 Mangrove soil]